MKMTRYVGWGGYPRREQQAVRLDWADGPLPEAGMLLPFGNGRSYGDQCLCSGGTLVDVRGLNRFLEFDVEAGTLRAEAGVTLGEMNAVAVAKGWLLPMNPGTQHVTLGGAIANDVHGKNQHKVGSFGGCVRRLSLRRGDGTLADYTPGDDMFAATVGGMGLTGIITQAEVQLMRVPSSDLEVDTFRFESIQEYMDLTAALEADADAGWQYSIAWLDAMAPFALVGRGFVMMGRHAPLGGLRAHNGSRLRVPVTPPMNLVTPPSVWAFGQLYMRVPRKPRRRVGYGPFFYYIDNVDGMKRIYGPKGFLQFQAVVPREAAPMVLPEMLLRCRKAGQVSFLNALKVMGDVRGVGMLGFCRPGVTLAMDLPNRGEATLKLMAELEMLVAAAGGALYPAKDATMSGANFKAWNPRWEEFIQFKDPRITSDWWRRVMGDGIYA